MNTKLNELICELAPLLKQQGFKKQGLVWYKENSELTVIFSVQRSQYGNDLWYYNFGIGINALEDKPIRSISKTHIRSRLDMKMKDIYFTADVLSQAVQRWTDDYGEISKLRICAIENRLPAMSASQEITYLTAIDLSKL